MASKKESKEKEIAGGELTDYPNDKYAKFFAKFDEIDTLEIGSWKPAHLLGYFCKKYKEQYDKNYQFKFNNPSPAKCFEVFQIKKLASMLSANPTILKEYIDWIYLNKVVKAKRRLTSISFMTHEGVVKEYKLNVLMANKPNLDVDRSTLLPSKYQSIMDEHNLNIKTYGDLAFISQMAPPPQNFINALNAMKQNGFNDEVLKRIV